MNTADVPSDGVAAPAPTPLSPSVIPPRARVVIVGGGVIGTSVAYHLTTLGWRDVVLLERDRLTSGTTWHAAGLITSAGMVDETALFMSRYSRDLYERLEEETGLSTGFRAVGHISIATNDDRMEALRREALFVNGFGVEDHELTPAEIAREWPLLKTDDLVGGLYVADEGRADPVGVAMSLARGCRMGGATVVEGVSATGVVTERGRVTGVVTDQGTIECEYVVNCGGMWARQFGALAGVDVPLQAAEHYYLITEPMEGVHRDLPVVEDPDCYGYFRPEGDGLLVGLFEPEAAAWSLDGVPSDSSFLELPPDYDRLAPFLEVAMARIPTLSDTGILKFFCGPESFTADVHPLLGPAPELDNYFVAAGLNSLGILLGGGVGTVMAHWLVDGEPPVDVTGYAIDRTAPHESTRAFRRERTTEQLGVLFGDAAYPSWRPKTARNMRRTVLHDRFVAEGAHFNASAGWEYPEWFEGDEFPLPSLPGFVPQPSRSLVAEEHRTVRERVGIMDMTLMAKFMVQGSDAATVLSRLSANHVAGETGRVTYTQWLTTSGGIAADLTVTRLAEDRFLVVASDIIQRRVEPMVRRATRPGEHCTVTDVTSGTVLLSVQGPASTRAHRSALVGRPLQRRLPLSPCPDHRPRLRPGPGSAHHLSRGAGLRAPSADRVRTRRLRRPHGGRSRPRGAPGGPGRHVQPAIGEGVPLPRCGHRQHRQPVGGRTGFRRGLRQAGRVHRPGGPGGLAGRRSLPVTARQHPGGRPRRPALRKRAGALRRTVGGLRAGGGLRPHRGRLGGPGHGRVRRRGDRRVAGLGSLRGRHTARRPHRHPVVVALLRSQAPQDPGPGRRPAMTRGDRTSWSPTPLT